MNVDIYLSIYNPNQVKNDERDDESGQIIPKYSNDGGNHHQTMPKCSNEGKNHLINPQLLYKSVLRF